jgi:hypothetical protein
MKFKLLSGIVALFLILISGCNDSNSPTQYQSNAVVLGQIIVGNNFTHYLDFHVVVDKNVVADVFGNHDESATLDELDNLDDYFAAHSEAWCLGRLGQESRNSYYITPEYAKFNFSSQRAAPYPSEHALRQSLDGASIRTPFVSIVVLQKQEQIILTKFFRSPGPGVGTAKWQRILVK